MDTSKFRNNIAKRIKDYLKLKKVIIDLKKGDINMKIKDYKLKKPVNISNLLEDGFDYSVDCEYLTKHIQLKGSIYLSIRVYLGDYSVQIDILDDDWCQYYIPFYEYKDNKIKSFKFLEQIIKIYHMEMDSLKSFEEK